MTRPVDPSELLAAFERGDGAAARQLANQMPPADVADFVAALDPERTREALALLPEGRRATVFGYLPAERQVQLARQLTRRELARLFEAMGHDDRADLFQRLDDAQRDELLPGLAHAEREDLRRLTSYPEGSAGAIMTSDYVALDPRMGVGQALERLRLVAPDAETIYQIYAVDGEGRLVGTLSLRDLIVAPRGRTVGDILQRDVVDARADEPQEEVARRVARYDLLALPIVDAGGRLLGIVTYDDAMDVVEEEATEDFYKSANVGALRAGFRAARVRELYQKRAPWLVLLVFGNLFSGAGLAFFEVLLAKHVALVFFLPLLVGSAGNAGSQAATMMVRALAIGEVVLRDWLGLLAREVLVGAALGLTMGVAVAGLGWARGGGELALVVSLTMVTVVLVGSLIGMSLPFLFSRFSMDPASASGPLVTTLADISGVLIYLTLARWLLDS